MTANDQPRPLLRLVIGEKGAGKTRWCDGAIASARADGHDVRGLLSPGVFVDGQKTAIWVRDIRSGEERPLARRRPQPVAGAPRWWDFCEVAMTWANDRLRTVGGCHTLVVDEVGPMELEAGHGWTSVWSVLRERAFTQAILTVRPALLQTLQERIGQLGEFEWEIISCPIEKDTNVPPGF